MAKNSRIVEEIDEAAMLQSIYERDNGISSVPVKPQAQPVSSPEMELQPEISEKPKEAKEIKEPVRRKRGSVDYSSLFLQKNELKARSCVYISQKIHATISEIVRVIANKDVTVGGYIDNVLLQHLEMHKDEINDLYKKERKDLIEF
ncbi:MAG: DUF3408 domain-containing protein [Tannerella sp.]|jgi:hypothetical protein|nr:DUF3408 domain-containing protein [Tannerella sp.]